MNRLRIRKNFIRKPFLFPIGVLLCALFLVFLLDWRSMTQVKAGQVEEFDWLSDWAVEEDFSLDMDSTGYSFPTAIAFVSHPGPGPKDPLYFVTELRGKVKVVSNDRTVSVFAENFFQLTPKKELPDIEGETGLAGICLAPEQGYVFVTFAYMDDQGVLRNNVVRFDSTPQTFSVKPAGQHAFTEVFSGFESAVSHQIGSCQVANNALYVGVGDGRQSDQSQKANALLGKVLRMTLDGGGVPENPFYDPDDDEKAADYVWAMGFRNPFGLSVVGDRVFVADNGSDLDRFVEVERGENYLWDGEDWSIGSRANVALNPDVGPVEMGYYPGALAELPEEFANSFYVATSRPDMAGILRIPYSLTKKQLTAPPAFFVKYVGDDHQVVAGVAVGPDGLYFVPVMPNKEGVSAVLKTAYHPDQASPYLLTEIEDPMAIMWEKGCFGCHQLNKQGGNAGPALDRQALVSRLKQRLNSQEYSQTLASVDQLNREPYHSFNQARLEVSQAKDNQKLRLWMIYHIMEPRFDNPYSQMPNLGLSKPEATIITDYLLREPSFTDRAKDLVMPYLPPVLMPRHLFFAFAIGLLAGGAFLALVILLRGLFLKRKARHSGD